MNLYKIVSIAFCFCIACFSSCTAVVNYTDASVMLDMVNKGANPLDAKCAIKGASAQGECIIRANKP